MILKRGDCPQTETFKDVKLKKLKGDWYTHASLNLYNMYYNSDCIHSKNTYDKREKVLNTEMEMSMEGNRMKMYDIQSYFLGEKLVSDMFGQKLRFTGDILDTDYDNYVIGYGCFD